MTDRLCQQFGCPRNATRSYTVKKSTGDEMFRIYSCEVHQELARKFANAWAAWYGHWQLSVERVLLGDRVPSNPT